MATVSGGIVGGVPNDGSLLKCLLIYLEDVGSGYGSLCVSGKYSALELSEYQAETRALCALATFVHSNDGVFAFCP